MGNLNSRPLVLAIKYEKVDAYYLITAWDCHILCRYHNHRLHMIVDTDLI